MTILEMALSLEYDLEAYYKKQAHIYKDHSLNVVFTLLAKEEANHVKLLQSKMNNLSYSLEESTIVSKAQKIYKNLGDFKSDIADIPSQLESYREALKMEEKSYDFYKKLAKEASDEDTKEMFEYLLGQEDNHRICLEELIKLLTRPEEWVESAEFGIREEY